MTDLHLTGPMDPSEHSDGSWVRREWKTLLVIAALTALVLVLAVTLINRIGPPDSRPRAAVGEVVTGPSSAEDADAVETTEVVLPWARMDTTVSEPLQELPRVFDGHLAQLRPPTGGSFIQVSVKRAKDFQIPLLATGFPFVGQAEAVLTADGRDYPLTTAGFNLDADSSLLDFGGTVWVAVEGKPTEAALSITVDGDTQVLADGEASGGRAAELADIPTIKKVQDWPKARCGRPTSTATDGLRMEGREYIRCYRQFAIRTPYVDGLGWAKEGRDFLVVHLVTYLDSLRMIDDTDTWWQRQDKQLSVTLDGQPSLDDVDANSLARGLFAIPDPDNPRHYIFDVPSDVPAEELEIAYTLNVKPADPFDADVRQVKLRWNMPSGDPAGEAE